MTSDKLIFKWYVKDIETDEVVKVFTTSTPDYKQAQKFFNCLFRALARYFYIELAN